jgi:hypothetical protein
MCSLITDSLSFLFVIGANTISTLTKKHGI